MTRVRLSKQKWSEIQKASGLPKSARKTIEYVLANYRLFQDASAAQPRAKQTRKELRRIVKLAEKIIVAILGVKSASLQQGRVKPDVLAALMQPTSRPSGSNASARNPTTSSTVRGLDAATTRDALQLLYDRVLTVEQLRTWFENAARSLPKNTKGPRKAADNHLWLVRQLDEIVAEYTGRHVNRSYKTNDLQHYIKLCFAAVDPNVGSGSINKAVQACVHLSSRRRAPRDQVTEGNRA
jgi:hypothetical protein